MRSFILGGVIAFAALVPVGPVGGESAAAPCRAGATSRYHPPATIRVWVPHLHRVWRPTMREYVLRVMSAGAAPAYLPDASLRVMAVAISQYAWYEALHPSEAKRSPRAGCWDIKNGGSEGQYVWPYGGLRPYTKRQEQAVDDVLGTVALKHGRFFRLGWRDGYKGRCGTAIDGWHIPEDEVTDCAKRGWGWRRILRVYLHPVHLRQARREP